MVRSFLTKHGITLLEVITAISVARVAHAELKHLWHRVDISLKLKVHVIRGAVDHHRSVLNAWEGPLISALVPVTHCYGENEYPVGPRDEPTGAGKECIRSRHRGRSRTVQAHLFNHFGLI